MDPSTDAQPGPQFTQQAGMPPAQPASSGVPNAELPGAPDAWPGAFGIYKYSKRAVMFNLWPIIVLGILNLIIGGVSREISPKNGLGSLLLFIVGSLLSAALTMIFIAGVRRQKLSVGHALGLSFPLWLKMIGLSILVTVSLVISLLLLVIPFFFIFPRVSLAVYFLVDKKLGVIEAYKASWAVTKGHAIKPWAITGASVAMGLLMITIIGIPFAIYFLIMYSAAMAVLYEFLLKVHPVGIPIESAEVPAPSAPTPAGMPTL